MQASWRLKAFLREMTWAFSDFQGTPLEGPIESYLTLATSVYWQMWSLAGKEMLRLARV